jgi:hypothetical protein
VDFPHSVLTHALLRSSGSISTLYNLVLQSVLWESSVWWECSVRLVQSCLVQCHVPLLLGIPATPAIDLSTINCFVMDLLWSLAIDSLMALALPLLVDSGTLIPQVDVLYQSVVLQLRLYLLSYCISSDVSEESSSFSALYHFCGQSLLMHLW